MSAIQKLKIFYYENQIYASMRQATGTLLPAVVIGGFFNHYMAGVSMTFGAFCLAMIDQSGGQRKNRIREFLSAIVLCTLVALVSSLSSSSMPFLLATVVLVCFSCGMLNVFGPRWGLVALTGLYVMILNVREPTVGMAIFWNSFYIFLGTVFYFVYTLIVRRYAYLNEERRAVFSAMMSTATYVRKRANLYNIQTDLAQAYDVMFNTRANMTTQFQTATDVLLSNFAKRRKRDAAELDKLQHLLANTMGIADALIATQTDYKALHQQVGESQFIDLCHETLNQLANNLESLANHAIHRNKKIHIELPTNNLKVISEDIRTFHKQGRFDADPAFRRLILQIVRRIRNVYFLVKRTAQLQPSKPQSEKFERFLQSSLSNVLSPQKPFNWALLKSNLNLNSSSFRYAIRLSIAGLVGILVPLFLSMFFHDQLLHSAFTARSYWVLLTLILVLKPGFSLSYQRNKRRLIGTLLGCILSFVFFHLDPNTATYFVLMWLFYVLALCFIPINYMYGATFVTLFIMIAFYFLHESGTFVIEERLVDTAIGCALAVLLSYILPNWESTSIKHMARVAVDAHAQLLEEDNIKTLPTNFKLSAETALSNLNAAFQRMISEPKSHQAHRTAYNLVMVQLFVLNSQIIILNHRFRHLRQIPETIQPYLKVAQNRLKGLPDGDPLPPIATQKGFAAYISPIEQLLTASAIIQKQMVEIDETNGHLKTVPANT